MMVEYSYYSLLTIIVNKQVYVFIILDLIID